MAASSARETSSGSSILSGRRLLDSHSRAPSCEAALVVRTGAGISVSVRPGRWDVSCAT
jgi:hypothetical protein